MRFQGAVIKEQGVTFGIVIVKSHVLNNNSDIADTQAFGRRAFGNIPIVLMAQNLRGVPTYVGRKDIVNFLANVHPSRIPWKEYTID